MSIISVNENLKNMFLYFVKNLNEESRIDIINKLTASLQKKSSNIKDANYFSGKWQSTKSAEVINEELMSARH